jgi:hypothetical protein
LPTNVWSYLRQRFRVLGEQWAEIVEGVTQPRARSGDAQRRDDLTAGAPHGRGDGVEADLQFLAGGGVTVPADRGDLAAQRARRGQRMRGELLETAGRHREAVECVQHLAEGRAVRRDGHLHPVARAEHVGRVDLRDLDHRLAARDRKVHRLAGLVTERVQDGIGQPDEL